jgi:hypothetical protein
MTKIRCQLPNQLVEVEVLKTVSPDKDNIYRLYKNAFGFIVES